MKYRLRIKSFDGVWRDADMKMGEEAFPYTIESNDVAELEDRQVSYSYTINLPKTENNNKIFNMPYITYHVSRAPYQEYPCFVYVEGVEIISNGVLIIESISEDYNVQILSGSIDLFDRLSEIDLKKEQILVCKRPYDTIEEVEGVLFTDFFDVCVKNNNMRFSNLTKVDGVYKYAYPLARVRYLIDKLLEMAGGYTFVSNVNINGMYLAPPTIDKLIDAYGQEFNEEFYVLQSNYQTIPFVMSSWENYEIGITYKIYLKISIPKNLYDEFIAANGTLSVKMRTRYTYIDNEIIETETSISEFLYDDKSDQYISNSEFTFTNDENNTFSLFILYIEKSQSTPDVQLGTLYAKIDIDNEEVPSGGKLLLSGNLGFDNGLDLFKGIVQAFGLMTYVDHQRKVLYAYTFDKIYENKSIAKDWTDKVAGENIDVSFGFGSYAQKNTIEFKEEDVLNGKYTDKSEFDIQDKRLETKKTVVSLPFGSGKVYNQFGSSNRLYYLTKDSDSGEYTFDGLEAAHLMDGDINHLMAEKIKSIYYDKYIEMLKNCVVLTVGMLLSPIDVQQIDPFVPIYLKQFSRYYYINKIDGWQADKVCNVELVQLPF